MADNDTIIRMAVVGFVGGVVYAHNLIASAAGAGASMIAGAVSSATAFLAPIPSTVVAAVTDLVTSAITVVSGALVGFLLGTVGLTRLVGVALVAAVVLYVWRGDPSVEYDGIAVRLLVWFVAGYALVRILITQGVSL